MVTGTGGAKGGVGRYVVLGMEPKSNTPVSCYLSDPNQIFFCLYKMVYNTVNCRVSSITHSSTTNQIIKSKVNNTWLNIILYK